MPSMTLPKTTCFPSRKSHFAVVMKNWHPFVLGPELACERGAHVRYYSLGDAREASYHGEQTGSSVLLLEVLILTTEHGGQMA